MIDWQPNAGRAPIFSPTDLNEACPPHLFSEGEAATGRVRVKLRNGMAPEESWPVIGRPIPTRWSLSGCGYDIMWWRRA